MACTPVKKDFNASPGQRLRASLRNTAWGKYGWNIRDEVPASNGENKMRLISLRCFKPFLVVVVVFSSSAVVGAESTYPSSGIAQNGNHITLNTDAFNLQPTDGVTPVVSKCAPAGSKLTFIRSGTDQVVVYFRHVEPAVSAANSLSPEFAGRCTAANVVNTHLTYTARQSDFDKWYSHANGVVFGGLVVPFKFRLGGVNELVSSSTIAPYIGWNFENLSHGLSLSPVISAGLALVPVADPVTKSTTSKSAFSAAIGIVLTSSKNADFHAGLIVGKDFLGRTDRALDPTLDKMWVSFYLGYKL